MELKPGYKQSTVGPIPEAWEVECLDGCVRSDAPICYGILMPGQHFNGGVLVVKVRDIVGGRVDESNLLRTNPLIDDAYKRSRLLPGDVLISIRGSTGRVAIASAALKGANITQDTARIRVNGRVAAEFIYHALQSAYAQDFVLLHTIGQAVKGINIRDVRAIAVALPPLPEQNAIAAALSDVDALLSALDRLIAKKRDLKQAAMQQLLTGQTRLPGFSGKWETKRFNDVLSRANAKAYQIQTADYQPTGSLPVVDQGQDFIVGFSDRHDKRFRCPRGGVIVFGDHTCIVKYVDFDFVVGADGTQILTARAGHSARFQALHLIYKGIAPTGYNRHFKFVKERDFAAPPLPEQDAIVAVLFDMQTELTALEQRRDKTRLLKQGMMQELLTGRTRLV